MRRINCLQIETMTSKCDFPIKIIEGLPEIQLVGEGSVRFWTTNLAKMLLL